MLGHLCTEVRTKTPSGCCGRLIIGWVLSVYFQDLCETLLMFDFLCHGFFLSFLQPDQPPVTQWQLDKWLKKSRKKSASSEQDSSQSVPGRPPSPHTQRAPSPARAWDSNQEYSPSQSPVLSPQFNYSHNHSPLPSPGYSYCPSPSPFTSTCPSPSPSPRHSPVCSPVPSVCPSPFGSPRASHSPSPISRDPPRSPSPSLPAPSRVCHYPKSQNQTQTTSTQKTKVRPWIVPSPNNNTKSKLSSDTYHQHNRPKTRPTHDQDQGQRKSKTSVVLTANQSQSQKPRLKPNSHPNPTKQLSEAPKAKSTAHLEPTKDSKHNRKPPFQRSSQHSPTRAKHSVHNSRETNTVHSSHSQSTSRAVSNLNPRSSPSQKHRSKSWEAPALDSVHVNHTKTPQKKPQTKEQEVDHRRDHPTRTEGRKHERKEDRHRDKQQGTRERKEDRRLAEEQLLRRPWIHSSAEEEDDEEGDTEIQRRRREDTAPEDSRRKKEQHLRREWQPGQTKQRAATDNSERHRPPDDSHHQERTKRGGRSEEERELRVSSPSSHSSTPHRLPSSSSASSSSNSDSESEYQAPIAKAPADSTSHKRLVRKKQGPGRPDAHRSKVVHPRAPSSGNPGEGQHSEGRQKLYTLVPFGRGDKAAPSSQRGLRNLVVHIDLCLLKRVPDSTTNSPVKKTPSFSSSPSSSSTKDKQREAMKHLCVPETKDGKRKRKVGHTRFSCPNMRQELSACFSKHACVFIYVCVCPAGEWCVTQRKQEESFLCK